MSGIHVSCRRLTTTVAVLSTVWLATADMGRAQGAPDSSIVPRLSRAEWIWDEAHTGRSGNFTCFFRRTFQLDGQPTSAAALITADNFLGRSSRLQPADRS